MFVSLALLLIAAICVATYYALTAGWRRRSHYRVMPPALPPPSLLLIIQGHYRTLDLTIDSILRNLCSDQRCHIVLSLASPAGVVSEDVWAKIQPHLLAAFYAEPGEDIHHPHYIFEYHQTLRALGRVHLPHYPYIARVRADCYLSVRVPIFSALGVGEHFERDWHEFGKHLPRDREGDSRFRLRAWLFTAAIPRLVPKIITQDPPPMAWSPVNSHDFNPSLLADIADTTPFYVDDVNAARLAVQQLVRKHNILYISGGLFLHFGPRDTLVKATRAAFTHWSQGPGTTLNWRAFQPSWTRPISQEANVRLAHHKLGYSLIDLHNAADYLVSFSWKYYGFTQLTRARGLVCWLLRERQVRFRWMPKLSKRLWEPLDNVSYPNPTGPEDSYAGGRPFILSHGCISGSTPAEMADCFEEGQPL